MAKHVFQALAALVVLTLAVACGGGGGGFGGGGGLTSDWHPGLITGSAAELTASGRSLNPPSKIITPLGEAKIADDGSFSVVGYVDAPSPAMLLDAGDNVVGMAMIEQGAAEIDNALQARSIAFL